MSKQIIRAGSDTAQFGKAVIEQPDHFAWPGLDAQVDDLLQA